ncbi:MULTISPECIES: acetylxylan esterase [Ligilactobacillus]|uniref:Acetylxylan esterase n=1 Tax=Ligilactobacillus animalis TaxID=1605 RepID=A0AAJ6FPZ2_9LACO|nr:acetylxylan esterase [Ligilactobacillus animalis]MBU5279179.1 acetylxylan esterase [Ligilactobacillus animalis]MDO5883495.1 acetylxylan esterase [Ligilactobacillus animalis]MDQ2233261.1 acetylxylan esterase [Ligilactobacillus animalis]MDU1487534.1 acetylxylan esterase [Ligilactobacillus animalis]MDU3187484.1 acetylxylan esterase [Ligilactobacillus animalis]
MTKSARSLNWYNGLSSIPVIAIYNQITTPKEHLILPECGHEDMHVGVNDQVFNWLFKTQITDC